MRYLRILSLLTLMIVLPNSLVAAPRGTDRADRIDRIMKVVKHFIASIQSRITIPIGYEPPPPTDEP